MFLEVPVFDIESARIAQNAGAHRIELCSSMADGGITPSYGTILKAREILNIPVFVMIRPRGGNFTYSINEIEIMHSDIAFCRQTGIDGVVFGVLTKDGQVDQSVCKQLIQGAGNMQCTFHRAFDRTIDPLHALEDIVDCGFHRILTSGQKNTAPEGIELIAKLVKVAAGRIIIMPGSGVNEMNLQHLHQVCKAQEYHSSAKIQVLDNKSSKSFSSNQLSIDEQWTVSPEKVRTMLRIAIEWSK